MFSQSNIPLISVIIVNYKVPDNICQLLCSLQDAELYKSTEIIIVDNASNDNSQKIVTNKFPNVTWIALKNNIGFGKACNVGAQESRGKYLFFINPDTLISQNTLKVTVDFFESNPDVGIMGPKIINPDGSFQPQCRRAFPTPFNAFAYMIGLSRLFPKSTLFGQYNLTYLSPDISMEIDAVSGSCMYVRKQLFNDLGGFDKAFFMYGEDLDLCAKCREKGYKVWYNPSTQVIHFKGKSCAKRVIRSRISFYEAMIIFSKKYRHSYGAFFPGWFLTIGIMTRAVINISTVLFKSYTACFIDLLVINFILWLVTAARFQLMSLINPYTGKNLFLLLAMHGLVSLSFLITNAYSGVYSSERYSVKNTLFSGLIASIFFLSAVFFIKSIAFSRIAFSISVILISLTLVAWREILPRIISRFKQRIFSTGNVIILGKGPIASSLIKNTEDDRTAQICGIIWPQTDNIPGEFEGYPVLGHINNITAILKMQKTDILLIATTESWYSNIIEALASLHLRRLTIQWVPHELFGKKPEEIPDIIPLNNFSV